MSDLPATLQKMRIVLLRRGIAPQDADDLVQEAFVRVESYARRHEVRSREALMVTAAINLSRDVVRHRNHLPRFDEGFDVDSLVSSEGRPEEHLLACERLRRLGSGINRLDDQTRRCLLAKRLEGLTAAQIAEREELSVAAVEKRITRALLFLAQWMGEI